MIPASCLLLPILPPAVLPLTGPSLTVFMLTAISLAAVSLTVPLLTVLPLKSGIPPYPLLHVSPSPPPATVPTDCQIPFHMNQKSYCLAQQMLYSPHS
jgi:hypothetical protein